MSKKHLKIGRRLVPLPSVRSMTDSDPVAPTPKPGDGEAEKPTDQPSEDLIQTIKKAYQ
jgi:hypothetical protein